jgi:hypothetical protein
VSAGGCSRLGRLVLGVAPYSKSVGSLADDKPVQAPLYDFNEFTSLIGFQEVWDFEKKYASLEAD